MSGRSKAFVKCCVCLTAGVSSDTCNNVSDPRRVILRILIALVCCLLCCLIPWYSTMREYELEEKVDLAMCEAKDMSRHSGKNAILNTCGASFQGHEQRQGVCEDRNLGAAVLTQRDALQQCYQPSLHGHALSPVTTGDRSSSFNHRVHTSISVIQQGRSPRRLVEFHSAIRPKLVIILGE